MDVVIDTPLHDTGAIWYTVLGVILPIICLIAGLICKKTNYIRNYKALKKGAIIGLVIRGVILALFGIFLLLSIL